MLALGDNVLSVHRKRERTVVGVPPPLPLRSMFAACAAASGVVYFNQVNIPPLPSGDWLRLRDGPSLLEEQTDTTRTGDLASVGGTVWPAAATLCSWMREHLCLKPSPIRRARTAQGW